MTPLEEDKKMYRFFHQSRPSLVARGNKDRKRRVFRFTGFHHNRSNGIYSSSFRCLGTPRNNPEYKFDVRFTRNVGGACWNMVILDHEEVETDFEVRTLQDIANILAVYSESSS
jgi:hypothetical protein